MKITSNVSMRNFFRMRAPQAVSLLASLGMLLLGELAYAQDHLRLDMRENVDRQKKEHATQAKDFVKDSQNRARMKAQGVVQYQQAKHPSMRLDEDGTLERGEYRVISPNGSITRALCPYTCEDRGLAKEHCRTWASKRESDKCYVQDTRLPSDAIPGM